VDAAAREFRRRMALSARSWSPLRELDVQDSCAELDMADRHGGRSEPMATKHYPTNKKPDEVSPWFYTIGGIFATLLLAALAAVCWWGR
jgi:hypothetical protein